MNPDRLDCGIAAFFILLGIAVLRDVLETEVERRKRLKKKPPFTGPWHQA